jgi:hypothetical protein
MYRQWQRFRKWNGARRKAAKQKDREKNRNIEGKETL